MAQFMFATAAAVVLAASVPAAAAPTTKLAQASPSKPVAAQAAITRADFLRNIDDSYAKIDGNRDGVVVRAELEAAQGNQARAVDLVLAKRRQDAFARLDTDKNGSLSLAEFDAGATQPKRPPADIAAAMARLDGNKDSKVTLVEYRAPALANFDRMDANKDGKVTARERAAIRAPAR